MQTIMRSTVLLGTLLTASPALAQLQPKMFPDTLPANSTVNAIYALHATSGSVALPPNGAVRVGFDPFAGFTVVDAVIRAHPGGCSGTLARTGNEITVTYPSGCAWGFGARLTIGVTVQTSINSGRTAIVTTFVDGVSVNIAEQVLIFGVVDFPVGPEGPMGPEGPEGPVGPVGPQGVAGPAGATVTSTAEAPGANCPQGGVRLVDVDGATFVCNGPAGPAGPEGPMGPVGPQGPAGPAGPAGAMGTMGEAGSSCSATSPQDVLLTPLMLFGLLVVRRRRDAPSPTPS